MRRTRRRRGSRAGSLLPTTLLVLVVSIVLTFATVDLALRATRRSRQLFWSDRLARAADEGLQAIWRQWEAAPPWTEPLGTVGEHSVVSAAGDTVLVRWRRTHPLIVWVQARAGATRGATRLERSVQRVAWLQAPVPTDSWAAALDALRDEYPPTPWDQVALGNAKGWRFARLSAPALASPLPRMLRHRGWVVVEGAVQLADGSEVEGLLVVRGALRVTGRVTVHGRLVVLEGAIPPGVVVHDDRTAVEMALATAARPRLAPFHHWSEGP